VGAIIYKEPLVKNEQARSVPAALKGLRGLTHMSVLKGASKELMMVPKQSNLNYIEIEFPLVVLLIDDVLED